MSQKLKKIGNHSIFYGLNTKNEELDTMTESGKKEDCRRTFEMINTHIEFLIDKMCDYIMILKTQNQSKDIEQLSNAIGYLNASRFEMASMKFR